MAYVKSSFASFDGGFFDPGKTSPGLHEKALARETPARAEE